MGILGGPALATAWGNAPQGLLTEAEPQGLAGSSVQAMVDKRGGNHGQRRRLPGSWIPGRLLDYRRSENAGDS